MGSRTARLRILAFSILAYVVTVGVFLLFWNAAGGGMVESWHEEYRGPNGDGSGSGKWRTLDGKAFQNIALLFGTWVYPLSLVAAALFARLAYQRAGSGRRLFYIGCGGVALYILYRLLRLGLIAAVTSS
ncbi:MAG: hypothetical protein ACO1SX_02645 [Actinomycetota bacterium]